MSPAPPLPPRPDARRAWPGNAAPAGHASAVAPDCHTRRRREVEIQVGRAGMAGRTSVQRRSEVEAVLGRGDGEERSRLRSLGVPPGVVSPLPLSIVKRRSMGGSSEESEDEKSIRSERTAVPGSPVSQNTMRWEFGYGATQSPPLRLKRVRPRAIRREGSLFPSETVPPAATIGDTSLYGGTPGYRSGESPLRSFREHEPYVLVPNVTVTPEVEVVGNGEATMWVAVELGAQLGRPDGAGAMAGWNGWGTIRSGMSEYGTDVNRREC